MKLRAKLKTRQFGAGCDRSMVVAVFLMPLFDGFARCAGSEYRMSDQAQLRGEEFSFFERFMVETAISGLPFASSITPGAAGFTGTLPLGPSVGYRGSV
ncbi:MAG: hypothetical protein Rhob2KO_18770 [Rhodopirellula baltica]